MIKDTKLEERIQTLLEEGEEIIQSIFFMRDRMVITSKNVYIQKVKFLGKKNEITYYRSDIVFGFENNQGGKFNFLSNFSLLLRRKIIHYDDRGRPHAEDIIPNIKYPKKIDKEIQEGLKYIKNVLINDFPQSQGSQTQGIRYHMVEFRRQNRHVQQRFFSDLV